MHEKIRKAFVLTAVFIFFRFAFIVQHFLMFSFNVVAVVAVSLAGSVVNDTASTRKVRARFPAAVGRMVCGHQIGKVGFLLFS